LVSLHPKCGVEAGVGGDASQRELPISSVISSGVAPQYPIFGPSLFAQEISLELYPSSAKGAMFSVRSPKKNTFSAGIAMPSSA